MEKKAAKGYLTAEQVADRFGVSKGTVDLWRKKGLLPAIKFGLPGSIRYRYRFDPAVVNQKLREYRCEAEAASAV